MRTAVTVIAILVVAMCTQTSVLATPFPLTGVQTLVDFENNPTNTTFDFGDGMGCVFGYINGCPFPVLYSKSGTEEEIMLINEYGQNEWLLEWIEPPGHWRVSHLENGLWVPKGHLAVIF